MKYQIYKTKKCSTNSNHIRLGWADVILPMDDINNAYRMLNFHFLDVYEKDKCDCEAEIRDYK